MTPEVLSRALEAIEREYAEFRRTHAELGTVDSPEGFASRFREWMRPHLEALLGEGWIHWCSDVDSERWYPMGVTCALCGRRLSDA
jgi:hypothetical protein